MIDIRFCPNDHAELKRMIIGDKKYAYWCPWCSYAEDEEGNSEVDYINE